MAGFGDMSIALTWLGHSTVVLDLDGARLLTDPLLSRHAGPLRRRAGRPRPETWARTDAVLVSHLHHDHAELGSLRRLSGVPVLASPENARWLRRRGITRAVGMDDGWLTVAQGVEVRLTRADHRHRPMPHRPNDARGHLVRSRSATVWVAGDTSLFDEMRTLPDPLGRPLDIAVVPISGWGPRLSPGHMDADQAAVACAWTGARWALPVHWGTLHLPLLRNMPHGWMDRPRELFARALDRVAPDCQLIDLEPGGAWSRP
jgi:L-ascorbate metabolism protein UlaG (beta-lactamase superfamily)